jgi:formylglycine-generating enzyme required for sulfatase activity
VVRGGSWNNKPIYLRSATRNRLTPVHRYDNIGFRLAQD